MFISATQVTSAKAPSDASAVAFQVAIKQQQEFEEALKRTQERRELEQAAERERLAERNSHDQSNPQTEQKTDQVKAESASVESVKVGQANGATRGAAVDVKA
jgi:hypothetical protein